MQRTSQSGPVAILAAVAGLTLTALWWLSAGSRSAIDSPLVVYCAHDAVYANDVLAEFTHRTGIRVEPRFDTEATKSLSLVNLIRQERDHPRCDVFWNNELLGTMELQEEGLLEPHRGSGWERIPDQHRDPGGYWVGFGARLRVWIVNKAEIPTDEESLWSALELETSRAAMAVPLFGTTLTHYAALHHLWGAERLKSWHHELRLRGLREVPGNALVKDLVATGQSDFGWTDTDDAFVALDDGANVEMVPIRVAGQAIAIPNTAAIVKGTRRRPAAERLVDFLASAETELMLARSRARQIPLGGVDETQLPRDVQKLRQWAQDSLDLRKLLPNRRAVVTWLQSEYAP